jgi:hypothetical protein
VGKLYEIKIMWSKRGVLLGLAIMSLLFAVAGLLPSPKANATTGINQEMSFEGKLVDNSGLNIADGNYNVEFNIYTGCTNEPTSSTGCTSVWNEDWLVHNSQAVNFSSGTFAVNLGSITSLPTTIWNSYPLYLSINVGNTSDSGTNSCSGTTNFNTNCDGGTSNLMNPYILLTSSPYALNAGQLGGLAASSFGQLATNQTWSGTNSVNNTSTAAFQIQNGIGTGNLLVADTSHTVLGIGMVPSTVGATLQVGGSFSAGTGTFAVNSSGAITASTGITTSGGYLQSGTTANTLTGATTISPTAASAVALTVNGTSGTAATALSVAQTGNAANLALTNTASTSSNLLSLSQNTSAYTGTAILVNLANGTGSFSSGNFIDLQKNGSSQFKIDNTGAVTGGTYNTNTFNGAALTFGSAATATVQPAASQALTITGHAASTWSTDSGQLTIQSGSGTVSFGTSTILNAAGALTLQSGGAGALTLDSASGTSTTAGTDIFNAAGGLNTGSGTGTQRIDASGNHVNTGNITHSAGNVTETLGAAGNTFTLQSSGSVAYLTADTGNTKVQIGSSTTDTTQINLALDQFSTFADTGTCGTSASSPNGALYYNTATNAIRTCINSAWEDIATTAGLGIMLYGVVPDSGAVPGDLESTSTAGVSGPCKISWASATSVTVQACSAYSGGRKITQSQVTVTLPAMAVNQFTHLCYWSGGVATGPITNATSWFTTASTTETANLPTFSANNPVVCLATIKNSGSTANTIGQIFDTRVFTTSTKQFANGSVALAPGWLTITTTTDTTKVTTTSTAATKGLAGVVVTGNASAWASGGPNVIIATAGPVEVEATGGATSAYNYIETTTTAGYSATVTTASTTLTVPNLYLGLALTAFGSCATPSASACQGSLFTQIMWQV